MASKIESDVKVPRFAYSGDETAKKLTFPRAELTKIEGGTGPVKYGAAEGMFDALVGRLDTLRWTADAASLGSAYLRDQLNRFDIACERIEMPSGLVLTRADRGVEILSPHVSLSEVKIDLHRPLFERDPKAAPAPAPVSRAATQPAMPIPEPKQLRQSHLRFLDSLSGRIYFTVKVELDLPVLGTRRLDQELKLPIQEGSLDYRALDDSLDWLEGTFLDIDMSQGRLAVRWKVPVFGRNSDLISWSLDHDASTLSSFGRVPVRSLFDYRVGSGKPSAPSGKSKIFQAVSLDAIDIALSLLAPRSVQTPSGGTVMFGGDDEPGLVDLKIVGKLADVGPGKLKGNIGSIDTTIMDAHLGPATFTADRLHFDGLDAVEVVFDGFKPVSAHAVIHRVTATNLRVKIGRRD